MDGFMVHCCKCDSGFEIDPDNVTCPECATKTCGTQPTDAPQLKAEILLGLDRIETHILNADIELIGVAVDDIRAKLSAV